MAQCTAKAKRTGERCKRRAVTGYKVCQVHGAGSPRARGTRGGRPPTKYKYSEHLPANLVEKYHVARTDTELLSLHDEIAVLDARLKEKFTSLGKEPNTQLWGRVADIQKELFTAIRSQDIEGLMQGLIVLQKITDTAQAIPENWAEIYDLFERRRKLVESERRRMLEAEQYIAAEELIVLARSIRTIILEKVTDDKTRKIIAWEIGRLISPNDPKWLDGAG